MQWPEGVAARRRVLVASLVHCLVRSKVCEVVDAATVQSVLNTAAAELWREGEFRLEYVWRMLCQQPELSAQIVAPPLLAFRSVEELLGVEVRLPPALVGLPKPEQARLLEELKFDRPAFEAQLGKLLEAEVAAEALESVKQQGQKAEAQRQEIALEAAPLTAPGVVSPAKIAARRRRWALGLSTLALLSATAAVTLVLLDNPAPFSTTDTDSVLRLTNGRRKGKTMVAELSDPRWEPLGRDEQQRIVERLFDLELPKGIFSISLSDSTGRVRAVAGEFEGSRSVMILPH